MEYQTPKERRQGAVKRYLEAYAKMQEGMTWEIACKTSGLGIGYMPLNLELYNGNQERIEAAVWDYIGAWNRITKTQKQPEYKDFRKAIATAFNTELVSASDEEIIAECIKRGIKWNGTAYYKEFEVAKIESEYISPI